MKIEANIKELGEFRFGYYMRLGNTHYFFETFLPVLTKRTIKKIYNELLLGVKPDRNTIKMMKNFLVPATCELVSRKCGYFDKLFWEIVLDDSNEIIHLSAERDDWRIKLYKI